MKRILAVLLALLCIGGTALADSQPIIVSVDATSWIVNRNDPTAYVPARMIDGDETTAFQFSTQTTPVGREYLYFYFSGTANFDALWIKNGFWKISGGLDQYVRNGRVRRMTMDFRYSGSSAYTDAVSISLPDDSLRMDWTKVNLGTHRNVTAVRVLIHDVYTGSKFPTDICISEVRFVSGTPQDTSVYGLATQKLATRSGPGTQYSEEGTYYVAGQYIKVVSRAYDSRNGIWWVRCEIPTESGTRLLWTGYKRFDSSTLPLESIPIAW